MILSVCQRLTLCEQRRPVRILLMETNVCYLKRKTQLLVNKVLLLSLSKAFCIIKAQCVRKSWQCYFKNGVAPYLVVEGQHVLLFVIRESITVLFGQQLN